MCCVDTVVCLTTCLRTAWHANAQWHNTNTNFGTVPNRFALIIQDKGPQTSNNWPSAHYVILSSYLHLCAHSQHIAPRITTPTACPYSASLCSPVLAFTAHLCAHIVHVCHTSMPSHGNMHQIAHHMPASYTMCPHTIACPHWAGPNQ